MDASSQTDQNFILGASAGYDYALNPHLMLGGELGYLYMGQNSYENISSYMGPSGTSATLSNWGIQLLATATYVYSSGFNVFGKAGLMYEDTTMNTTGGSAEIIADNNGSESGVVPVLAIGIGYDLTQNLDVTFQYEAVLGDNYNFVLNILPEPESQNIFALGLSYKFGQ